MTPHDNQIIYAHKEVGETPLECLDRYRKTLGINDSVSMTYAGRLDPLARGILPLLIGDSVHQKEHISHQDKEYRVEILVGVETDTYDILGIPKQPDFLISDHKTETKDDFNIKNKDLEKVFEYYTDTFLQTYPPYSSRTVEGKPLWQWAREGRLREITLPTHAVSIQSITPVSQYSISDKELLDYVNKVLGKLTGDFRQTEIMKSWKNLFENNNQRRGTTFPILALDIACGSGTYIRQLVHDIGNDLNIPMCVYSLERTRVGK